MRERPPLLEWQQRLVNVGGTLEAMKREKKNRDRCAGEERPMQTSEGGGGGEDSGFVLGPDAEKREKGKEEGGRLGRTISRL